MARSVVGGLIEEQNLLLNLNNVRAAEGYLPAHSLSVAMLAIATGSLADADATFAVKLEHGSQANLSDAADVVAKDLLGTTALAAFTYADDNKTRKIGYRGDLRYTRLTITPSGNAAAALVSAIALLGHPQKVPTVNPPV